MFRTFGLLAAALFISASAWAYDTKPVVTGYQLPGELEGVGVDEHLGAPIDLTLEFTDDHGVKGPLRQFFTGNKPVIMAMVYYSCPTLCNLHLNGLTAAFKQLKWVAGKDFEVVTVSMLATETPDLAAKKKHNYLSDYGHPEVENGWHFLVGSPENIKKLADEFGFHFKWLEDKKQFAHASVAYVMTPDGKISRYLNGIAPDAQTMKLSLLEAGRGQIGNIAEQALMFCFQFDPHKGKYTLYAWNIMRIGAIVMVLLLAIILIPLWRREQTQHRPRT
jgi:protein SCO1/2